MSSDWVAGSPERPGSFRLAGCLLVVGGLDADATLADIDRRRSVTRKAHQPAPQTPAQTDVIRTRAARPRRGTVPGC